MYFFCLILYPYRYCREVRLLIFVVYWYRDGCKLDLSLVYSIALQTLLTFTTRCVLVFTFFSSFCSSFTVCDSHSSLFNLWGTLLLICNIKKHTSLTFTLFLICKVKLYLTELSESAHFVKDRKCRLSKFDRMVQIIDNILSCLGFFFKRSTFCQFILFDIGYKLFC